MRRSLLLVGVVISAVCACIGAGTKADAVRSRPQVLPLQQEISIALSAGPANIRSGAGVFALEEGGYVQIRRSKNGFNCIVNRDHPLNMKPTCFDAEGSATIIPVIVRVGALLMQGQPVGQIRAQIKRAFATGEFTAPRRPGVAYMLSNMNRNYNPQTGRADPFPPHVMFYAPHLTDADIGSTGDFAPGMPSIAYQGPDGMMIVVLPQCAAQTPASPHGH
jgi:hypothetical protein